VGGPPLPQFSRRLPPRGREVCLSDPYSHVLLGPPLLAVAGGPHVHPHARPRGVKTGGVDWRSMAEVGLCVGRAAA